MPGYVKKKLQEYNHIILKQTQMCPYSPSPKQLGSEVQEPLPEDKSPWPDKTGIHCMQQIVGSILYYARAVNMTVLMALSTITSKQTHATEQTMKKCTQLFDYFALNSNAKVQFYATDMVMNIHSDALYLSEAKACNCTCRHFFVGWFSKNGEPIQLNQVFHINFSIL
jgi:hypothetical protein